MATLNNDSIRRKLMAALKRKIQRILTPEEFESVTFSESGNALEWDAPKEIQKKIEKELKGEK